MNYRNTFKPCTPHTAGARWRARYSPAAQPLRRCKQAPKVKPEQFDVQMNSSRLPGLPKAGPLNSGDTGCVNHAGNQHGAPAARHIVACCPCCQDARQSTAPTTIRSHRPGRKRLNRSNRGADRQGQAWPDLYLPCRWPDKPEVRPGPDSRHHTAMPVLFHVLFAFLHRQNVCHPGWHSTE